MQNTEVKGRSLLPNELYPEHEPAAARLRDLRLSRGEVERLISALTQAAGAAQKERSIQLWIAVAELYADRKGDLPAALAALTRANALAPNHVGTLLKLGDYFARDAQWQQAAERWKQAAAQASANDAKMTVVDGVNTPILKPPPDSVSVIDFSGGTPRIIGEVKVPTSIIGPPQSVAIAPDESIALVAASTKIDPADPTKTVYDNVLSVIDLKASPPAVIRLAARPLTFVINPCACTITRLIAPSYRPASRMDRPRTGRIVTFVTSQVSPHT